MDRDRRHVVSKCLQAGLALLQAGDGLAAHVGGAASVSTDAQGLLTGKKGVGTIPHALIAARESAGSLTRQNFGDVDSLEILVLDSRTGETLATYRGGDYASVKRNGCYAPKMPKAVTA